MVTSTSRSARSRRNTDSNFCHTGSTSTGDDQVVRINDAPSVEVHIVRNNEAPGGMGEPGTAAIMPAIANAIFAATGKRLRRLPVDSGALKQPI